MIIYTRQSNFHFVHKKQFFPPSLIFTDMQQKFTLCKVFSRVSVFIRVPSEKSRSSKSVKREEIVCQIKSMSTNDKKSVDKTWCHRSTIRDKCHRSIFQTLMSDKGDGFVSFCGTRIQPTFGAADRRDRGQRNSLTDRRSHGDRLD